MYLGQLKRSSIFPGQNFRERYPNYSSYFYLAFFLKTAFSTHGRHFVLSDADNAAFEISFNYEDNLVQFGRIEMSGIRIADRILDVNYFVENNYATYQNRFPPFSYPGYHNLKLV